jgi:hypothetical protein
MTDCPSDDSLMKQQQELPVLWASAWLQGIRYQVWSVAAACKFTVPAHVTTTHMRSPRSWLLDGGGGVQDCLEAKLHFTCLYGCAPSGWHSILF